MPFVKSSLPMLTFLFLLPGCLVKNANSPDSAAKSTQGTTEESKAPEFKKTLDFTSAASAMRISFLCSDEQCEKTDLNINYKFQGGSDTSQNVGTDTLENWMTKIKDFKIKKKFWTKDLSELKPDPHAGGLNLFFPVVFAVAATAAVVHDSIEATPLSVCSRKDCKNTILSKLDSLGPSDGTHVEVELKGSEFKVISDFIEELAPEKICALWGAHDFCAKK